MGGIDGRGKIKMASASTQSVNESATIIVHTEKLKQGPIAGKLVSGGISHVAFASVLLGENPSEEVDDYDNYYYDYE